MMKLSVFIRVIRSGSALERVCLLQADGFPVAVDGDDERQANGGLGGFNRHGGGFLLDVKRWLLAHEGS